MKNRKGHLHGSLESENEVWRKVEDEVCGSSMEGDLILVVTSTLPLLFTKLPLCHSELQKITSRTLMLAHSLCWRGNDMEMMWKWRGDSFQLNIDVQAPKLLHPNT